MATQMVAPPNANGAMGGGVSTGPNVSYTRSEVTALMPKWEAMRIILEGEHAVKAAGLKFLPLPSCTETNGIDAQERYTIYKQRAVFYNATRRTLDGLMGQVFSRDPIIELPPELQTLIEDCDGAGVSMTQQARETLSFVMAYGRCGMLGDYPQRSAPASKAQILSGEVRPNVMLFDPWSVINWRTKLVGGMRKLSLVVISENFVASDDGFETKYTPQWRVLKLSNAGVYSVEIWRQDSPESGFISYENYIPKDADGKPFNYIPFTFVGCTNNNEYPDQPPLYDLMTVNIGHYRNSADYEESCFMVGQPTPVFTGLTQQWVDEVMKGQVFLGSRGGVMLPIGGDAKLLQVAANSMPMEAMVHKEGQMLALGAKLVEQSTVQKTLGEAQINESSESSILATAAKNVSLAYTLVLGWAGRFVNAAQNEVRFDLNTDFPATRLTPNDRAELVLEWQSGAISYTEMRGNLRRAGVATLDDAEAQAESEANPSPKMVMDQETLALQQMAAETAKTAAENPPPSASGGPASKKTAAEKKQKPSNAPSGGNQAGT